MEEDIGYMQIHFRIYRHQEVYEEFALNARDECYIVQTDLLRCEHKAIEDPADTGAKVVQVLIKIPRFEYTMALLVPFHASESWEVVQFSEGFSAGFYCILSELGERYVAH